MPQLDWSHFKPDAIGKPDKDVESHVLGTNDWMGTHTFQEDVKVQWFCLTLLSEVHYGMSNSDL